MIFGTNERTTEDKRVDGSSLAAVSEIPNFAKFLKFLQFLNFSFFHRNLRNNNSIAMKIYELFLRNSEAYFNELL